MVLNTIRVTMVVHRLSKPHFSATVVPQAAVRTAAQEALRAAAPPIPPVMSVKIEPHHQMATEAQLQVVVVQEALPRKHRLRADQREQLPEAAEVAQVLPMRMDMVVPAVAQVDTPPRHTRRARSHSVLRQSSSVQAAQTLQEMAQVDSVVRVAQAE